MSRFLPWKKNRIWVLIALFGALYSLYSVVRHLRLGSFIFDLGVYDQIIWLASRGKPFFSSILEAHPWGDHFGPTLLLLTPLYWLWDNVLALLIFQGFFAAFGAYPIYLLAKKKLEDEGLALVFAFAYLAFYGMQNAIAFDFHPIVLAATLLAWLFWLYEEKKFCLFWLAMVLMVGLQENFFLLAAAFGVFLIFRYRDFRRGLFLSTASLFLFFLVIGKLITFFGQAPFTYAPTHLKNLSLSQAIKMFFTPSSKIQVVVVTPLAFGFLPVFSPAAWILLLEEYLQRFIGTPISTRWNLAFQYNAILAPIVAWGAIEAGRRFFLKKKSVAVGLLLTGVFVVQILTDPAFNDLFRPKFYDFSKTREAKAVLTLIPPTASVAATNNLGPQLTHRKKIIFLTNCYEDPTVWKVDMKRCFQLKPDFLVADLDPSGDWVNFYPDGSREMLLRYLDYVQKEGEYRLVRKQGEAYLLERIKK